MRSVVMHQDRPVTVALTGASGAYYGLRLVESLLRRQQPVDFIVSDAARLVLQQECGLDIRGAFETVVVALDRYFRSVCAQAMAQTRLRYFARDDWMAPMASGSGGAYAMVVCPCSMGTLAAIAHGLSDNLIERAADVIIKEKRTLILVPRETPLSAIHLKNMLSLAKLGVIVLPAAPGFYHRPKKVADLIDFVVARILDQLGITHALVPTWPTEGGKM